MKWRYLTVLMALIGGLTLIGNAQQNVQAASTPGYDWMNTLPNGTQYPNPPELSPGMAGYVPFTTTFSLLNSSQNNAIVLTSPQDATQQVGLVVTTGSQNQNGAIWSNDPIFDLNKQHQSISMDLLIQSVSSSAADGMAFALAGTKPTTMGTNGASLGVWGKETVPTGSNGSAALSNQLQNSAVIVMDTYHNGTTLDSTVSSNQYVGFGYPSLANTYTTSGLSTASSWPVHLAFNSDSTKKPANFTNTANPALSLYYRPNDAAPNLASSAWHIFEVNWDRTTNGGTLTYKLSDENGANAITRKIPWTDAQIDSIFGSAAQKKVYVGFTGSTGSSYEANVLAFRSIPGLVNASSTVSLTKSDGSAAEATTSSAPVLKTNDRVQYNYSLTYDNDSKQDWSNDGKPLTLTFPTSKYLHLSENTKKITINYPNGKTAQADVTYTPTTGTGKDAQATVTVSNIPPFTKPDDNSGSQTLSFSVPMYVDTTIDNDIGSSGASFTHTDNTGTFAGYNSQIHAENPATDSNTSDNLDEGNVNSATYDPFTIKYTIQRTTDPYVPKTDPQITTVPTLDFINLAKYTGGSNAFPAAQPKISDLITGKFTTPPGTTPINDYALMENHLTGIMDTSDRLEKANYQALTVTGNGSPWKLSLTLTPFATASQVLLSDSVHANVLFSNNNGQDTSSLWPSNTEPTAVKDNSQATTILDSSALPASNAADTDPDAHDFSTGIPGQLFSFLYLDGKIPTARPGDYTSTATWTLTTAP